MKYLLSICTTFNLFNCHQIFKNLRINSLTFKNINAIHVILFWIQDSFLSRLIMSIFTHSSHKTFLTFIFLIFQSLFYVSKRHLQFIELPIFSTFFEYTTYEALLQMRVKQCFVRLLFLLLSQTNQHRQQPMKSGPLSKTEFTPYLIQVNNNW